MILSPTSGWNGWVVEAKVRAGFKEHSGPGEDITTATTFLPIQPGSTVAGGVLTLPPASVSRTPHSGAAKDKAEGTLAFKWTTGTPGSPDAFEITVNGMTSAVSAMHNFGAGMVPADSVFDCELKLRTFAPVGPGNSIRVPDLPALSDPTTETMTAVVDSPLAGFFLPGGPGMNYPIELTAGQHFTYTFTYAISTPHGTDPPFSIRLLGSAGGPVSPNVVPNPEFESGAPTGTPVTTIAPVSGGPGAAEAWLQGRVSGSYVETRLFPSTNTLGGSCGRMLCFRSDGTSTGSSSNHLAVNLPVEVPPGSRAGVDVNVVSGSLTAAFAVNTPTATVLDMAGAASTGPTGGWKHLTFTNTGVASAQIQFHISAPAGGLAEVCFDNVTATAPLPPRTERFDYPGDFRAPQRWIGNFCGPGELPVVGDFNGDGLDDIARFLRSTNPALDGHVYVALNSGDGSFAPAGLWHGFFCVDDEIPAAGDFDGDGRDDIVTFVPSTGKVWVALSNGSSFCSSREWYDTDANGPFWSADVPGASSHVPLVGDFNGDGLADIAVCTRGTTRDLYTALNTGRGFGARRFHTSGWDFCPGSALPRIGDVTGDGRDDIVVFFRDSGATNGLGQSLDHLVEVFNLHAGVAALAHFDFAPTSAYEPLLADLNGDGSDDIVAVHADGSVYAAVKRGSLFVSANGGGYSSSSPHWLWRSGLRASAAEIPLAGRFNRDLNTDLAVFVRGERSGADYAATLVALCGTENPARPDRIDMVIAPPVAEPGDPILLHGVLGVNWQWRVRLAGPDGSTLLLPVFESSDGSTGVVKVPTGCYPGGLYRLLIFDNEVFSESDRQEQSSTSWAVNIRSTEEAWRLAHFTAWERSSPAISGDDADTDMDGYSNLAEYLLGTNPRQFGHPAHFNMFRSGDGFMASFRVRDDRGCVRMTMEESDDLINWVPAMGGSSLDFPGTGDPGATVDGFLPFSPVFLERPRNFSRVRFSRL